jgi:hypothetical protein
MDKHWQQSQRDVVRFERNEITEFNDTTLVQGSQETI